MNKKIIFSGTMMLVLLASCGTQDITDSVSNVTDSVATVVEDTVDTSIAWVVDETVELGEGFADYDESLVGESENTVLFFHSAACSSCRATAESIMETWAWDNTTILKVDYDDSANFDLVKQYEVPKYHTFVQIDSEGNMIKKWSGSLSADDIAEQLVVDAMMEKDGDTMMEKDDEVMEKDGDAMMEKDESVEGEVMESVELSWIYADYDASLVGKNDSTVLAFFAAWCPSCVSADASISGAEVPDGLSILKVDYDSATDLRQKYGVTSQHTFVQVDADGNLIKKWAGWQTVEDVVERVQ